MTRAISPVITMISQVKNFTLSLLSLRLHLPDSALTLIGQARLVTEVRT